MPSLLADAPAIEKWTLENIAERSGDRLYDVEHYADEDRSKAWTPEKLTFGDYVSKIRAGEEKRWFAASLDLDRDFPEIADELPQLPVMPEGASHVLRSPFFGRNTETALHIHTLDQAILVQVQGPKRVVLVHPDHNRLITTNHWYGSRPQYSTRYPEAGQDIADYLEELTGSRQPEYELAPGDALFIPIHWWHWAFGEGDTLSVTTFWRAALREWHFPQPGLRSVGAHLVAKGSAPVKKALERIRP